MLDVDQHDCDIYTDYRKINNSGDTDEYLYPNDNNAEEDRVPGTGDDA